jgi:hypothetical protein
MTALIDFRTAALSEAEQDVMEDEHFSGAIDLFVPYSTALSQFGIRRQSALCAGLDL